MILTHHGGRGAWLRLKDITDYYMFINNVNIEQKDILSKIAQNANMEKVSWANHLQILLLCLMKTQNLNQP